jgi:hypothetical protein
MRVHFEGSIYEPQKVPFLRMSHETQGHKEKAKRIRSRARLSVFAKEAMSDTSELLRGLKELLCLTPQFNTDTLWAEFWKLESSLASHVEAASQAASVEMRKRCFARLKAIGTMPINTQEQRNLLNYVADEHIANLELPTDALDARLAQEREKWEREHRPFAYELEQQIAALQAQLEEAQKLVAMYHERADDAEEQVQSLTRQRDARIVTADDLFQEDGDSFENMATKLTARLDAKAEAAKEQGSR